LLVDDYAHHPTEIRATLKAARAVGRKRVLTMFQPHRYSRTTALRKEFAKAFDDADRVVVTDVYPASESPIPGVSGQTIVEEIVKYGHRGASYQPRFEHLHCDIGNTLDVGDLVLSLGAGNIHEQLSILAADLVIAEKLTAIVGETGGVRLYEPLSKHTTLRVGGPAQFWVEPQSEEAFAELIRFCRDETCRFSSSVADRIFLSATVASAELWFIRAAMNSAKLRSMAPKSPQASARNSEKSLMRGRQPASVGWSGWKEFRERSGADCA